MNLNTYSFTLGCANRNFNLLTLVSKYIFVLNYGYCCSYPFAQSSD
ncbi:hypothetical protein SAMN04515668_1230 [Hymenobacter arizonensis]|uniref:Uncharacterized protein n=1 Tax=Hymenobacter arizonensis TaxID=1227077 RepID=A0A1I5V7Y6_HYMAR|nr:hypothetical protein SAMN04515668_1230 [Hymenobacter arizonensis]